MNQQIKELKQKLQGLNNQKQAIQVEIGQVEEKIKSLKKKSVRWMKNEIAVVAQLVELINTSSVKWEDIWRNESVVEIYICSKATHKKIVEQLNKLSDQFKSASNYIDFTTLEEKILPLIEKNPKIVEKLKQTGVELSIMTKTKSYVIESGFGERQCKEFNGWKVYDHVTCETYEQ